jgi:hypothetical protein
MKPLQILAFYDRIVFPEVCHRALRCPLMHRSNLPPKKQEAEGQPCIALSFFSTFSANGNGKLWGLFSLKRKLLERGSSFGRLLSDPNIPFHSQSGRAAVAAAVKVAR